MSISEKKMRRRQPGARHQDWASRLHAYLDEVQTLPFEWGKRDCCLFVCDGLRTITGLDPAAKMFRGKYRDATGAARLLKKHGGVEAVAKKICRGLEWPEVRVALAQRGDVVLLDVDASGRPAVGADQGALGLCVGRESVFMGIAGQQRLPTSQCRRAWAVARPVAAITSGGTL